MNGDALRSSLKYITTQTHQNDQPMLFQVTEAGTALSINYGTKQYWLLKTTLISSVSHFNFGVEALFEGATPTKAPLWRRD